MADMARLLTDLAEWYGRDQAACEDFCVKMGGRGLTDAVKAEAASLEAAQAHERSG